MADKGDVYYCTWRKAENGEFIGWEKRDPSLKAQGATPRELQRELVEVVVEHYDDQEAALHFDPLLSETNEWDHLFADRFFQIGWNAAFSYREPAASAFLGGRCPECGIGLGERNAEPLRVDAINAQTDGAFSSAGSSPHPQSSPAGLILVSDRFVEALTDEERATFDARPVELTKNPGLRFFEVVPKAFIPEVAIKDVPVNGWRCERCGRLEYSHGGTLPISVEVVCRSDLPSPRPPFLFVGAPRSFRMYATKARWDGLCGKPFARKLDGSPLASVDESLCERNPRLQTLAERLASARKFGAKSPFRRPNTQ